MGDSKRTTRVTAKLMTIETDPNMPMVEAGSHVSAKKSSIEAAADKKIAMTKSGLQKTGEVSGDSRLCFFVRGSLKSVWFDGNF